jgi:pimeloyl-ACP methyl ester carboxylesterase
MLRIVPVVAAGLLGATAESAEPEPKIEKGEITTHDGFSLAYERMGRGPQVVLVPARLFLAEAFKGLSSPRRTLVFYDMRNRGRSQKVDDLSKLPSPCAMANEWPVNVRKHFNALFGGSIAKLDIARDNVAARVKMPVLTIHGRKDRNAPYGAGREWAQLLPNARLLTLDNAAHNSWADEPDVVLSAVREFVGGSWPVAAERLQR